MDRAVIADLVERATTDKAIETACVVYHGGSENWAQQVFRSPPLAAVTRDIMRASIKAALLSVLSDGGHHAR